MCKPLALCGARQALTALAAQLVATRSKRSASTHVTCRRDRPERSMRATLVVATAIHAFSAPPRPFSAPLRRAAGCAKHASCSLSSRRRIARSGTAELLARDRAEIVCFNARGDDATTTRIVRGSLRRRGRGRGPRRHGRGQSVASASSHRAETRTLGRGRSRHRGSGRLAASRGGSFSRRQPILADRGVRLRRRAGAVFLERRVAGVLAGGGRLPRCF